MTSRDKDNLEIIRNLSGETLATVNNVLKALMAYTILNYSENEVVSIPHFGTFKLMFKGDKIVDGDLETLIDTFYSPSEEIKYNIGKYEEIKNNGGDLTTIPLIKDVMNSTRKQLTFEI